MRKTLPKEVIHVRVSPEMKQQIEKTAQIMRDHFAGAEFSVSDIVRLCVEGHIMNLREMYR